MAGMSLWWLSWLVPAQAGSPEAWLGAVEEARMSPAATFDCQPLGAVLGKMGVWVGLLRKPPPLSPLFLARLGSVEERTRMGFDESGHVRMAITDQGKAMLVGVDYLGDTAGVDRLFQEGGGGRALETRWEGGELRSVNGDARPANMVAELSEGMLVMGIRGTGNPPTRVERVRSGVEPAAGACVITADMALFDGPPGAGVFTVPLVEPGPIAAQQYFDDMPPVQPVPTWGALPSVHTTRRPNMVLAMASPALIEAMGTIKGPEPTDLVMEPASSLVVAQFGEGMDVLVATVVGEGGVPAGVREQRQLIREAAQARGAELRKESRDVLLMLDSGAPTFLGLSDGGLVASTNLDLVREVLSGEGEPWLGAAERAMAEGYPAVFRMAANESMPTGVTIGLQAATDHVIASAVFDEPQAVMKAILARQRK